jgi:hypothetical protein
MNARDFEKKNSEEKVTPQNLLKASKPKTSAWDKLSELSLDTFSGRVKFLFIFVLIGLGTILIGDLLKFIPLRGTGIAFQIMGWLLIAVGFLGPLFKFLDEHS